MILIQVRLYRFDVFSSLKIYEINENSISLEYIFISINFTV